MNEVVDVKDLSIGDIFRSIKRLKLSSAIWIVTSFIVLISGAFSAGASNSYFSQKKQVFTPLFTENFVDRESVLLLLPEILEEAPDGLETDAEAMASLLWQLKSQDGYAQFLSGNQYVSVQISYTDNNFNFKWDSGKSVIPKILNRLSIPVDELTLAQLNAELNLVGVAWLPDNNQIVRDIDGGLALVGKE